MADVVEVVVAPGHRTVVVNAEQIARIADPVKRGREAEGFLDRGRKAIATVKTIRDDAVADLLLAGRSQRDVARELDVSPSLVAAIATARQIKVTRVAQQGANPRA